MYKIIEYLVQQNYKFIVLLSLRRILPFDMAWD